MKKPKIKTVLLSVRKVHLDKYWTGEKGVELRRVVWTKPAKRVLVYESRGSGLIVGEFSPLAIWNSRYFHDCNHKAPKELKKLTCLSYAEIAKYFKGSKERYYIRIKFPKYYKKPLTLKDVGLTRPPQNFCYLRDYNGKA